MPDSKRRRRVLKAGLGLGVLVGGGGGTALYGGDVVRGVDAWMEKRERRKREQRERRREQMPEEWAREVEHDVQNNGSGDGLHWDQTYVDVENVDVVYEQTGRSGEGAPRYRFTARAPLTGAPFDICDYTREGGAADLSDVMERDSLKLYEELFDQLRPRFIDNRRADQPAVSELAVRYGDGTGTAGFAVDAGTAERAADGWFAPETFHERVNFLQLYRARFDVECDTDG